MGGLSEKVGDSNACPVFREWTSWGKTASSLLSVYAFLCIKIIGLFLKE